LSSKVQAALLLARTVRHLEAEQVTQRALRGLRRPRGPQSAPAAISMGDGWEPRVVRCRRPLEVAVLDGEFEFWGVRRRLALDRVWEAADLGLSWNYPLHYHDALPALASTAAPETRARVRAFIGSWIDAHPPGTACAWDPYPTALRIVNWLDVVGTCGAEAEPAWRERVFSSIWLQAAWLEARLERHLLGTHLLKDAKALAIAGAVFNDAAASRWRRRGRAILRRELGRQIHADGGHIEPSIAYHALALEDVLDLLAFASAADGELRALLSATAARMLGYLAAVETPGGGLPLLGDSGADAAPEPQALFDYASRLGIACVLPPADVVLSSGGEVRWLSSSGVCVYRDPRQYALIDAGGVGPPHLAGHGHCDSLSFEWWVDGVPVIVDTGTTSYEPGPLRDACRATRAHNTIELDGREQHEIWAAFRVARRSRVRACLEKNELIATLRPWHAPDVVIERRFAFDTTGIGIHDSIEGRGSRAHAVTARMHLHPDSHVRLESNVMHVEHAQASARIESDVALVLNDTATSDSVHCARLGVARANAVITLQGNTPWRTTVHLRVGRG